MFSGGSHKSPTILLKTQIRAWARNNFNANPNRNRDNPDPSPNSPSQVYLLAATVDKRVPFPLRYFFGLISITLHVSGQSDCEFLQVLLPRNFFIKMPSTSRNAVTGGKYCFYIYREPSRNLASWP